MALSLRLGSFDPETIQMMKDASYPMRIELSLVNA
jgi:hypothetical protein